MSGTDAPGPSHRWVLEAMPGGQCAIRSSHLGGYLDSRDIKDGETMGGWCKVLASAPSRHMGPCAPVIAAVSSVICHVLLLCQVMDKPPTANNYRRWILEPLSKIRHVDADLQPCAPEEAADAKAGVAAGACAQARDALAGRGERLDALGESTERMGDEAREFAGLATELRRKAERGGFW